MALDPKHEPNRCSENLRRAAIVRHGAERRSTVVEGRTATEPLRPVAPDQQCLMIDELPSSAPMHPEEGPPRRAGLSPPHVRWCLNEQNLSAVPLCTQSAMKTPCTFPLRFLERNAAGSRE